MSRVMDSKEGVIRSIRPSVVSRFATPSQLNYTYCANSFKPSDRSRSKAENNCEKGLAWYGFGQKQLIGPARIIPILVSHGNPLYCMEVRARRNRLMGAPDDGLTLRVLVIDDCTDTTTSLSMLLKLWGHDVRVAHDGAAGLEAARAYWPHVILLDIALREKFDGYEVARQLRDMPVLGQTSLICLTGYATLADVHRSQEAGFDHHVAKPADPDELERLLAAKKAALCAEYLCQS